MTRAYAGLAALDALYLAAGLGLLAGFGLVRSPRAALRLVGVAFTVGWAATGIACVLLLVVGASLAPWQVALTCLALACAGLAAARRTPAAAELPPIRPLRALPLVVLAVAVVVLYLEELGRRALGAGAAYHQDAWGFWLPKAKVIALFGGLDTSPGGVTSFFHADYPPLVPALDAVAFRFMGGLDASVLPLQEWIVSVAFVAAVAGLLVRRVPAAVLWPCLALVVLSPSFGRWIGVSLADLPLALLFALAGVAVALWLSGDGWGHAALAATLLAAAALTKAEGLSLAVALALFATLASVRSLRTRWPGLVALVALPVLALLPWRRWLDANEVMRSGDVHFHNLLDPGYLADRTDRLHRALAELPAYLVGGDDWLIVLPLALAAAAVAARAAPGLALLLAGTPLFILAGNVAAYWISVVPIEHYIDTSAERTVLSPVLFAGVLLPLALARALEDAGGREGARLRPVLLLDRADVVVVDGDPDARVEGLEEPDGARAADDLRQLGDRD